jgi:hypothetical protein
MALNHRWCVGVDLHKDTLTACMFCGCCGEVSFQKIACRCRRQIAEYFAALPRPHTVAIESAGFYRWLWELLEPFEASSRSEPTRMVRRIASFAPSNVGCARISPFDSSTGRQTCRSH